MTKQHLLLLRRELLLKQLKSKRSMFQYGIISVITGFLGCHYYVEASFNEISMPLMKWLIGFPLTIGIVFGCVYLFRRFMSLEALEHSVKRIPENFVGDMCVKLELDHLVITSPKQDLRLSNSDILMLENTANAVHLIGTNGALLVSVPYSVMLEGSDSLRSFISNQTDLQPI